MGDAYYYICCMKKLLLFFPVAILAACGDTEPQQAANANDTMQTAPPADPMPPPDDMDTSTTGLGPHLGSMVDGEYITGNDEIVGYYELVSIQEGSYPQFILEARTAQGNTQSFFLNTLEYRGSTIAELTDTPNRKVKIAYWVRYQNNVARILAGDVEVEAHEEVQPEPQFEQVTGILVAEELSKDNEMSAFVVAKDDGTQVYFPYIVTKELAAHNGEEVTVYYAADAETVISYIKVLE